MNNGNNILPPYWWAYNWVGVQVVGLITGIFTVHDQLAEHCVVLLLNDSPASHPQKSIKAQVQENKQTDALKELPLINKLCLR